MPDVRISDLPVALSANDAMQLEVNDGGTSRRVTVAQVGTRIRNGSGTPTAGVVVETGNGGATRSLAVGAGLTITNPTGAAGNPTISPDIATQTEAEAGISNTKLMTPLRVAQAIAALGGGTGTGGSGGWVQVGTALMYDFGVNGLTAQITSPVFEDGFEYMFLIDSLRSTATALKRLEIQFESGSANNWLPRFPVIAAPTIPIENEHGNFGQTYNALQPAAAHITARLLIPNPRLPKRLHVARAEDIFIGGAPLAYSFGSGAPPHSDALLRGSGVAALPDQVTGLTRNDPYTIRRVRFSWGTVQSPTGGGQFNQGTIRLMRRGFATI